MILARDNFVNFFVKIAHDYALYIIKLKGKINTKDTCMLLMPNTSFKLPKF